MQVNISSPESLQHYHIKSLALHSHTLKLREEGGKGKGRLEEDALMEVGGKAVGGRGNERRERKSEMKAQDKEK